jgi:molybdopterin synthase sulfur carrier subunit
MYDGLVARLRLFASAREAAGTSQETLPGSTVGELLEAAKHKFGPNFVAVLPSCKVWVNGEAADLGARIGDDDEVAVLPPVSGGDR